MRFAAFFRWQRRHKHASARAEDAHREVEVSRRRLERVRAEVVRPLREAGERNQFADLIRASLEGGRHTA